MENNCKICEYEYKNLQSLAEHIRQKHKELNIQKYYDLYLLENDSNKFCKYCQKELKFKNLRKGYGQYCSKSCSNKSEETKLKYKQKMIQKYGVDNSFKSDIIKEKIRKTNLERYGNELYLNSLVGKEIKKNILLRKYGVDHYSKTNSFRELMRQKCFWITDESRKRLNNFFEKDKIDRIVKRLGIKDFIIDSDNNILFYCSICKHKVKISIQMLHRRFREGKLICNNCNKYHKPVSDIEVELLNFIKFNYNGNIITNTKNILDNFELDIYLPDLRLAFEFNGLYWHSELYKDKNYHLNKTEECEKQGIHLVQIYEDEWIYKQDIVKSRILNLLGKSEKIPARKCEVREVSFKESKEFLEKNHIQGFCVDKIRVGLFYNNKLVSLMTFGNLRKNLGQKSKEGTFELLRFCNLVNYSVIGGANKLFKFFIKKYNPIKILSYADRSWTMNNNNTLYDKLGFKLVGKTKPNYYYCINKNRKNRFVFRKSELIKQGFDKNKTEHGIMLERDIYRIYDSGSLKFQYNNKKKRNLIICLLNNL